MDHIRIAHLSDIHYNPEDKSVLSRMFADRNIFVESYLEACFKELAEYKPDIILISGDLTHEAGPKAYQFLRKEFDKAFPDVPVLCAMGNHDIRPAFREGFLGEQASDTPYEACVMVKGCRFISMDSAFTAGLEGVLTDEMIDRLESLLTKPAARGSFLLMHHPVMREAKTMGFTMSERFARLLQSRKITGIFNGHVHGTYASSIYGVPQFTAESIKTGCNIRHNTLSYTNRAGYETVTFDSKGDWTVRRRLLHPETEILFEKEF